MNNVIVTCSSCGKKNRIPADKQHLKPRCGHCKSPVDMKKQAIPVELNDHEFHSFVKNATKPVMVDFFSPSCGPCQTMLPIINDMAKHHINKSIIAKLDTSRNPQIPSFFNIRGVPTFMFFSKGSLIDQVSGAVSRDILENKLDGLQSK